MEVKKDILWRVNLGFIIMAVVGMLILGKAFYIQQVQGDYWRGMSDSLHQKIVELDAERGTIYSEDGSMLSTSIPQFDIYIDFVADGLREKNGKRFRENVDSLSICLSKLFQDQTASTYRKMLQQGYREKDRYFLLKRKVSFKQYQQLRTFPLVRLGRNKSGFVADTKTIRLNPYKLLASRTIGLLRDSNKVGLELTYNHYLRGVTGKRLVRYISGGASVPVDDLEIEPQNGKDVVTTLDVNIQDVTENALMKMMEGNEAEHGCAIVMEVKTGKIKAIANLGRDKTGKYWEDYNYAITPSEPGSTFKLATMLAVLEDKKATLNTQVDLHGGEWKIFGQVVYDSEKHGLNKVTLKQAFEHSSNVGMAKLAWMHYGASPKQFLSHLSKLRLDTLTGIDINGEIGPRIYRPGNRSWSRTTLPWMGFGYNLMVSPLQVLSLYNAVANNGVMLRPYLVNEIREDGSAIKTFEPVAVNPQICSKQTLKALQACLEGVMTNGTGKALENRNYKIAGKTGTALVANGKRGYIDRIYQSSFAGYFPADRPEYSIIVTIKNKPRALKFYGAAVAGPVFKEIADQLFSLKIAHQNPALPYAALKKMDSANYAYAGYTKDIKKVVTALKLDTKEGEGKGNYSRMVKQGNASVIAPASISMKQMPALHGMGLKDVVYLCENLGMKVSVTGRGKVVEQSVAPGRAIAKGQIISVQLN
ncbi:PASTA domain-containing protein [Segetibacter sp. 3557_3]|uniref:penicillin-binding protein n=1 Tax=Segetibacter sp. 3557_3 TaxID=2547429 RepID=UPI0010588BBF|nr:penicillin-binding protein [Segetibacter sp. 3557_3]TDH22990.1 PASTA domain-containing protein [Segetibacter sp. 3557_3]